MTIKQAFRLGSNDPLFVAVRIEHEEEGARTFIMPIETDESEESLRAYLWDEWGEEWKVELIEPEGLAYFIGSGIELCAY